MRLGYYGASIVLVLSATTALADPPSPLVAASRKSREARADGSRPPMVINNQSVKRSRPPGKPGRVQVTAPVAAADVVQVSGRLADALEQGLVAEREAQVVSLQLELLRIEEEFYREADPGHRDKVLRSRFVEVKGKLSEAKRELALLKPERSER